jgi:uncharacterized protein (DUF924 family)
VVAQEESYEAVNQFWFGRVEKTIIPTENRAKIWFGESEEVDQMIKSDYGHYLEKILSGEYQDWSKTPHGQLASILVLDQFSRHIYRAQPKAYEQDHLALELCLKGMEQDFDHQLSLIERVFYYFPLLHSENIEHQFKSLRAYQLLAELAFSETRAVYDSFLKFANHHYTVIESFGRFPQRNEFLNRVSTQAEVGYLVEIQDS